MEEKIVVDEDIDLLEYVKLIFQLKSIILVCLIVGLIAGVIFSFTRPSLYKAETVFFLPPGNESSSVSNVANSYLKILGAGSTSTNGLGKYIFMLVHSRKMKEYIAEDIRSKPQFKNIPLELHRLLIGSGANGTYELSFIAKDPKIILPVLESCFNNLQRLNIELNISGQKDFVVILDEAKEPGNPFSPNRLKIIAMFMVGSFILSIIGILAFDFFHKLYYENSRH